MTPPRRLSAFILAALCSVLLGLPHFSAARQSQAAIPFPLKHFQS
jgi:hypothetical protein